MAEQKTKLFNKGEFGLVALMFSYFFLVISVFWILKPLKKGAFLTYYKESGDTFDLFGPAWGGPQAELIAKCANLFVAFATVAVFTMLARKLRRQQLTYVFSAFSLLALAAYSLALRGGGEATVWHFYVFGDLFNMLMVPTFFAFLNDSLTPDEAKRLYGPIVLGGVCGGALGSMFLQFNVDKLHRANWMWVCFGAVILIAAVGHFAGKIVDKKKAELPEPEPEPEDDPGEKKEGNAALEGARLVFKSKYLLSIVAIVGIYEIVSQLLDYQFTVTIDHFIPDDPTSHLTAVYSITNGLALLIQLFLVRYLMVKRGLVFSLLVMPVAILASSSAFLIIPLLWVGSSLSMSDNALNYSLNQSARESLYTATTREEKYKAKAFIDMFVQRLGKVFAIGASLAIAAIFGQDFSTMRYLSLLTIVLVIVWVFAARYAGKKFHEITDH